MSPFFDDLEAQLRSAARSRAGDSAAGPDLPHKRRRRRGWLRAGIGAAPVLAAVLIALAVVGAALVLVGHRGHGGLPPTSPPGRGVGAIIAHTPQKQLRRELAYIATASQSVNGSKACRLKQPAGVSYIHGSPGSDLLSILGVLRRPATAADRINLGEVLTGTPNIYRGYVRRASSLSGVSYYIVPTRYDRAASIPSDHCFKLQVAALDRELPKIPASLREPTRELQAAMIGYARTMAAQAPRDTICFLYANRNENGGACGTGPEAIREGQAVQFDQRTYSGVVPDGVATATVIFPAAGGHPARSVTAPVTGNVYVVPVHNPSFAHLSPTVIWRSAEGRVLKRISPPNEAAARTALCKQEPIACLLLLPVGSAVQTSSASGSSASTTSASRAP